MPPAANMLETRNAKSSSLFDSDHRHHHHHWRDRLGSAMMSTINGRFVGPGAGVDPATGGKRTIEDELSLPILLAERVRKAVGEAESFKTECAEMGRQADLLADMLRAAIRRLSAIPSPYERPALRIAGEASKALDRALSLARRCRRSGVLCRVVSITTGSADFRKALALLEASLGDLRWLLSVYSPSDDPSDGGAPGGLILSLPPIASTDPILSWVWSCIATVQMATCPSDRAEAAASLANLALDSGRNKKIIIDEGGVPPLLSLLRDGAASLDGQIAAATALANLAADRDLVSLIVADLAVPVVVQVLADAPMRLQSSLAALVARMAAHDPVAQEEFARENVIRPLVSILSFEVPLDDRCLHPKKTSSIPSLVRINRDITSSGSNSNSNQPDAKLVSASRDHHHAYCYYHQHHRKDWENESPEVKLQLKVACAEALWMLSRNCLSNSRKITETKGLLCLSKHIELETGELQLNCLMTLTEIAAAAESDADLRRSAFKMNSLAAKSVVEQLLRVALEGSSPLLQILAIKSLGSLARTFPARETRVLRPLVVQLGHWNPDVATEAAISLGKFACPQNFLCVEHSKAIVEFEGVPRLMRLLRPGEKTQLPGLVLLCYLAMHVPSNEALERAKALATLESVSRGAMANHASLRELLPQAIYQLELYRAGGHTCIHIEPDSE
ncbi:Protein ARABIDILLO 1 [Cocos nucifera]|uniref:Protein ARABIDILLO 1 n=1 Tax=Cocos nucifera TaxID=13894 RepID=A0A8K0IN72_COCNU|nr:Protein ARABIDILLO 1 [Cocos nucifera]